MDYTIVTAFYIMKSKFSLDKYKEWISNFLGLHTNCICFTNEETRSWFLECFDVSKIHFILFDMNDFITSKYDWEEQYQMDDEKFHTRELYMVWNEKINFLKKATEINPFHTEWFLWCDMGSMRSHIYKNQNFKTSHIFQILDNKKSYFFRICNGKHHNPYFLNHLEQYFPTPKQELNIIQGGFILSNINSIQSLHDEFYTLLDQLYEKGLFIGKDQCVYNSLITFSKITRVIELLNHRHSSLFWDYWFFVYPFMLGTITSYRFIDY